MDVVQLTDKTVTPLFRSCFEELNDKNIIRGVYFSNNEKNSYLIFDSNYLSDANLEILLNIATVYNENICFSDDFSFESVHNIESHLVNNSIKINNMYECTSKKYWGIRLSREHTWRKNYLAEMALFYCSSVLLRQDPRTIDAYSNESDDDVYEAIKRYIDYPEDLEPYYFISLMDYYSVDYRKQSSVVQSEELILNKDTTKETLCLINGDEYRDSFFEVKKRKFLLHPSTVLKNYEQFHKKEEKKRYESIFN